MLPLEQIRITVKEARIGGEDAAGMPRLHTSRHKQGRPGGVPMSRWAVVVLTPTGDSLQSTTLLLGSKHPQ